MTNTAYRIEPIAIRTASAELMRELFDLSLALHREASPDDPEPLFDDMVARHRNLPALVDDKYFVARDAGGRLVGLAASLVLRIGENEHMSQAQVEVLPDHRRRGLGRLLLAELVAAAAEQGATTLTGASRDRVPAGAAFARRFGAQLGQEGHENRLDLGRVDRDLVQSWVKEGPGRAPGYSLVFIDGRVPDELLGKACEAFDIMNTAPRDDFQMDDIHMRPELYREYENQFLGVGRRRWSLYAQDDASGRFVGFTELSWNPEQPDILSQGGTAVEPGHRGHALGKWLKAEMVRRVLDDVPGGRFISTSNADSNDAMLGINRALGFGPYASTQLWQLALEEARSRLQT